MDYVTYSILLCLKIKFNEIKMKIHISFSMLSVNGMLEQLMLVYDEPSHLLTLPDGNIFDVSGGQFKILSVKHCVNV